MGYEFIEGNEAIARAAMKAGCDFFASYPITPASSILHYMNYFVPEVGGMVIQAEDEIASMGFCIAAAMAGRKVLTSTSGPGISLYSENIGLAIMGETPIVIVNIQRQGPATGSATKGAEGDILFTRWVTSGGQPIIALSPATVAEAYELTFKAFNFAEQYRCPVFLICNKEIGVTKETVDLEAVELPERIDRKPYPKGEDRYLPHRFGELDEVPAFSPFGGDYLARYTTSTHDEAAYLTTKPEVVQKMIDHYHAKIEAHVDELTLVKADPQEGADTLVVSYGITSRSAAVAVAWARARGRKVSSLVLQTLYPVPEAAICRAMEGKRKVVVPEMNMGQYVLEIERLAPDPVEVVGVGKMNTTLLTPQEIIERGGLL
ncbi:MAG: pyruvate flavodoxin/ferredoxin oxidoreductase [Deltaproteobacteria bacterium]|jgi:2-oxoglutarate ferredoxin oxidoreductase subunit alpha|nr:pyruvate flavodoxin/ferredoxin oxidoreductase [Deltaproteobacteria bacterium]MBW2536541.1 pyruvate flavodoxin/ferredoxin oxidoreductase [Deltaproteobacteria bacterium]